MVLTEDVHVCGECGELFTKDETALTRDKLIHFVKGPHCDACIKLLDLKRVKRNRGVLRQAEEHRITACLRRVRRVTSRW